MPKGNKVDIQDFLDKIDNLIAELNRFPDVAHTRVRDIAFMLRHLDDQSEAFVRRCVRQHCRIVSLLDRKGIKDHKLLDKVNSLVKSIPSKAWINSE